MAEFWYGGAGPSRGGGYEEERFGGSDRRGGFDARPDDRGRDRGGFRCAYIAHA